MVSRPGVSCDDCVWRHLHPHQYDNEQRLPTPLRGEKILASAPADHAHRLQHAHDMIMGRARTALFVLTGQMPEESGQMLRDEYLRQLCCAARHGGEHRIDVPEHMRNRQPPEGAETALGPLPPTDLEASGARKVSETTRVPLTVLETAA